VSNKNVSGYTNAKLPKLVITKFNGDYTDWQRFWSQFEAEIDRASVAGVTKFSYLKELVEPSVRATIDGLPFSTEGYERAKNILKDRYGKTSEIVNAYIKNIMSLPKINGSHTPKIILSMFAHSSASPTNNGEIEHRKWICQNDTR